MVSSIIVAWSGAVVNVVLVGLRVLSFSNRNAKKGYRFIRTCREAASRFGNTIDAVSTQQAYDCVSQRRHDVR